MELITIVTGCMGRLRFLEQALPTWMEFTPWPIVIVDYSCPDGVGAWAAQFASRVSIVSKEAEIQGGKLLYNASKAHNAGIAAVKEGYLLFLDSDIKITLDFAPRLLENLKPDVMCLGLEERRDGPGLFGVLGVHKNPIQELGGYDENFEGWGHEDIDMYVRLYLHGVKYSFIPANLMQPIRHSNEIRTKNYSEKNPAVSRMKNRARLDQKLLRETGKNYEEWLRNPEFYSFLNPSKKPLSEKQNLF